MSGLYQRIDQGAEKANLRPSIRGWTEAGRRRYLLGMSKNYASLERKYWLETKARGKRRFIWRDVRFTLLICLVAAVGVPALTGPPHSFSARSAVLVGLIILPISLLGGYLTGIWRWKDLEKKYPEDSLPPSE